MDCIQSFYCSNMNSIQVYCIERVFYEEIIHTLLVN